MSITTDLNIILASHLTTIHEIFQASYQTAPNAFAEVTWDHVNKMAHQVSKHATTGSTGTSLVRGVTESVTTHISDTDTFRDMFHTLGMLWDGKKPDSKAIEENMAAYFNTLQAFLLLSHGSTVGAGPTLSSTVHALVKRVVDSSFRLMKESVSLHGSHWKDQKLSIPQLVDAVMEACSALKKCPLADIIALVQGMTVAAVSAKNVIREMQELKSVSLDDQVDEDAGESCAEAESEAYGDNSSEGDPRPEEMKVAERAIIVIFNMFSGMKVFQCSLISLLEPEKPNGSSSFMNLLGKLTQLCRELKERVDEIGEWLDSPQVILAIKAAVEKTRSIVGVVQAMLVELVGILDIFMEPCIDLSNSLKQLAFELGNSSLIEKPVWRK